jgi:C-terminal processing protease CtpA/Prc
MTAISFIGRPNTRTFGQPSGGFTSANSGFKLSDGSMLQLAVSYTANRNKKEYRGKIQPEVIITEVAGEDATLKAAQEWLLK